MRGNERGDHQAWLDWAAFGLGARSERKGSFKLEDGEKTSAGAGCSVPVVGGRGRKGDRQSDVLVETRTKGKRRRFFALQKRVSRALTGKEDASFMVSELGYTVEQLRDHLERQFSGRMTWSNYAGNLPYRSKRKHWHVDHITPKSKFSDDDAKTAYALSNLRPLWAKENMIKGVRKTHLI